MSAPISCITQNGHQVLGEIGCLLLRAVMIAVCRSCEAAGMAGRDGLSQIALSVRRRALTSTMRGSAEIAIRR